MSAPLFILFCNSSKVCFKVFIFCMFGAVPEVWACFPFFFNGYFSSYVFMVAPYDR